MEGVINYVQSRDNGNIGSNTQNDDKQHRKLKRRAARTSPKNLGLTECLRRKGTHT